MMVVARSTDQSLRAALLWCGARAAAAGSSAGGFYNLEGVRPGKPEVVVVGASRPRHHGVVVHRVQDRAALMLRSQRGFLTTGVEPTLVALAGSLDAEAFEVACEDARRRGLTSIPALTAHLDRFGRAGRAGIGPFRGLLRELDPKYPARSTLEVKTRRLLVAHGFTHFVREFPLDWSGCRYLFDFAFERERTILEVNGRRWHGDVADHEYDNEKWSVPGRRGYRIVLATWSKVTEQPERLLRDLAATMAYR